MHRSARWFIAIAGMAAVLPATGGPRASIEGLQLSSAEDATTLVLSLSAASPYRLFTLTAPDRVVLDVLTARLGPGALPLPAGTGTVRQVRAANRPDGSVRVVLDTVAYTDPAGVMRRAAGSTGTRLEIKLVTSNSAARAVTAEAGKAASVAAPVLPAAAAAGKESTPPRPPAAEPLAPAVEPAGQARAAVPASRGRDIVIAVDAGHGGKDPGAHGPSGVREKEVTLRIARQLVEIINAESGMRGVLTRDRDEFIPLRLRMERARAAQADLFVSVHADAVRNPTVRGSSVYVLNEKGATDEAARRLAARENAADLIGGVSLKTRDRTLASVLLDLSQNASMSSSIEVADEILDELARVGTVRKPHVMQAPFMVLKSPDVPSVLVETAYISNPQEERRLDSNSYRARLAGAIFAGIRSYFYRNAPRDTLVAQLSQRQHTGEVQHVIRRGETLSVIADRYNTSVGLIRDVNRLKTDRVAVGQVIRIPRTQET